MDDSGQAEAIADLPPLSSLNNLTPLLGRVSAIHTSFFFHLFNEEQQTQVARKVASLLSAEPGSVIFGAHGGSREKGFLPSVVSERYMFCHSPESWVELWEKEIFQEGQVRAKAHLREVVIPELENAMWYVLIWSITRL